jgi:CheY-like chemotaxis protein
MNPMAKHTILWADDDSDDLQMMREILSKRKKDFEIAEVHNGKEALDYLHTAKRKESLPCLIILDINMPVLDGKETLSILKSHEEYKNIPVVVFTTSESELDKLYCRRFNTEMVSKPPTFSTLNAALDKLLNLCKQD